LTLKIQIAVAAAMALPFHAFAEQPVEPGQQATTEQQTVAEQEPSSVQYASDRQALPTLIVEGSAARPGTFGTVPDSTGLKDTASMLERVPGANVNRNGPLTGIAAYRGMFGNRVNVSIDGANFKEVGPNSMDPPLSHIPAPLTESLQVYRGLAPVSSGIETIGGSIKAKSRKGEFYGNGFKLTDEVETNGLITGGYSSVDDGWFTAGLAAIANENHKFYGSGVHQEGRDYSYKGDKEVRPTQYDRDIWNVGYGYQRDGHELGINYSDNDTGHTGTPALPMDIMYVRGGNTNMDYQWEMDNGHQIKTNIYYQDMRHEMNNFTLREAPTMVGMMAPKKMLRQSNTDVRAGGLDLGYSMQLFSGDFTFGFNGDQADHDAKVTDPTNATFFIDAFNNIERDRYSFYGEWEGEIAQDFSVELGARFINANTDSGQVYYNGLPAMATGAANKLRDDFNNSDRDKSDNDVDLVSILRYSMNSTMDWEIGFARKNRAPSYQERYLWIPLESTGGYTYRQYDSSNAVQWNESHGRCSTYTCFAVFKY
jgi:iron complex outermembrane receptor protein